MKIKFLPFINNSNGKKWRENREKAFLSGQGMLLTKEINDIRSNKNSYADEAGYYAELHTKKAKRQKKWLEILTRETAKLFSKELDKLSPDDKDNNKTTIVAALPEFFWCDINDNRKHGEDIDNYHKPLYLDTVQDILVQNSCLSELTREYPNLIIFAGTVMWKKINQQDNKAESIYNTLLIYCQGALRKDWSKHNISYIDGFYKAGLLVKDKAGASANNSAPTIEFNGLRFVYDICLDFVRGNDNNAAVALSTELCGGMNADVNVLIAAGMPIDAYNIKGIKSEILLRCDGLSAPYGEISEKNYGTVVENPATIDSLEINI